MVRLKKGMVVLLVILLACTACWCEEDDYECQNRNQKEAEITEHNKTLTLEQIKEINAAREAADEHNRQGKPNFPVKGGE